MVIKLRTLALIAITTLATACGAKGGDTSGSAAASDKGTATSSAAKPEGSTAKTDGPSGVVSGSAKADDPADSGLIDKTAKENDVRFVLQKHPSKKEEYKPYDVLFDKGSRIEQVLKALEVYKLPRNVPVAGPIECGEPNA